MIIGEVLGQLENASGPVIKVAHQGPGFKLLVVGFKGGMTLKEHKTMLPARLMVVEGSVVYNEGDKHVPLRKQEDYDVPVDVLHSVTATEDSVCVLIQG